MCVCVCVCSTSQGELKDGIAAYERAVQIKPDLKEAWFNMAQVRMCVHVCVCVCAARMSAYWSIAT